MASEAADASGTPNTAHAPDLKPYADQLMVIAERLRDGSFSEPPTSVSPPTAASNGQAPGDKRALRAEFVEMARRTYAVRRQRAGIFGSADLFGEPAWDILLDLYIAFGEEKPVSVSSACIGSASPPTTGLRWLGVLADHGLVVREQDPDDQRRVLVRLTDHGVEAMDRYFDHAAAEK
ncbi:MAG: winged helix DNA-binding protein [Pseudomonadota bacterium]